LSTSASEEAEAAGAAEADGAGAAEVAEAGAAEVAEDAFEQPKAPNRLTTNRIATRIPNQVVLLLSIFPPLFFPVFRNTIPDRLIKIG